MARAKSIKGESTAAVTNSFVHGLLDRVSAHLRLSCPRGGPYRTCLSSIVTLSLGGSNKPIFPAKGAHLPQQRLSLPSMKGFAKWELVTELRQSDPLTERNLPAGHGRKGRNENADYSGQ